MSQSIVQHNIHKNIHNPHKATCANETKSKKILFHLVVFPLCLTYHFPPFKIKATDFRKLKWYIKKEGKNYPITLSHIKDYLHHDYIVKYIFFALLSNNVSLFWASRNQIPTSHDHWLYNIQFGGQLYRNLPFIFLSSSNEIQLKRCRQNISLIYLQILLSHLCSF